jgi:integrase
MGPATIANVGRVARPGVDIPPIRIADSEIAALREQAAAWRAEHCWSPNQLRHTAGTAIRKRFGAEAAQTVLGHSHLTVTEIYAERDLEKAAEVIRQLG